MLAPREYDHIAEHGRVRFHPVDFKDGGQRFESGQSAGAALIGELHATGYRRGRVKFGIEVN